MWRVGRKFARNYLNDQSPSRYAIKLPTRGLPYSRFGTHESKNTKGFVQQHAMWTTSYPSNRTNGVPCNYEHRAASTVKQSRPGAASLMINKTSQVHQLNIYYSFSFRFRFFKISLNGIRVNYLATSLFSGASFTVRTREEKNHSTNGSEFQNRKSMVATKM